MIKKTNYVYSYRLPDLNAIKVGHGENPLQRMISYTKKYKIEADKLSLKVWEMPSSGIASNIEKACHETLLKSDFVRLSLFDEDTEANEIFSLQNFFYDDAVSLLVEEIDENINYLRKSLENKNFGDVHRKEKKRDELKKRRKEEDELTIKKIMKEIKEGYDKHYSQYLSILKRYHEYNDSYLSTFKQRTAVSALFRGWKTHDEFIREWDGLEKSVSFVKPLLKSSRIARSFYHSIKHKYPNYKLTDEAEKRLGFSLTESPNYPNINSPCIPPMGYSYQLPDPRGSSRIEIAKSEILCCLNVNVGNGDQFILENKQLKVLLNWVIDNPPQELQMPEYNLALS